MLLVEASKVQSLFICKQLNSIGVVNIEHVDSIFAAKKSLSNFIPELIISSMYFQDGCGIEFIEYVKNVYQNSIAFVLISSEQNSELLNQVKTAGSVAILTKPFKLEELEKALNLVLLQIDELTLD
ncbi:hypothetical protein TUM4438_41670 [Shewanella sairae]|uniref:Response regulatory domain-containing protein n=1 Tax=Shewanella sairae TaxID=190310 RepID=A0ABQ4PQP9_9GAMM|nr:hypothetical protein TUM4438_41670 [Shewanella sairae]